MKALITPTSESLSKIPDIPFRNRKVNFNDMPIYFANFSGNSSYL